MDILPVTDAQPKNQRLQEVEFGDSTDGAEKRQMILRLESLEEKINTGKRDYTAALETLKSIWEKIESNPSAVANEVNELVDRMISSVSMESDVAIHLMSHQLSENHGGSHAMNVAMLSMIMARDMGLRDEQIKLIGIGALFHDIGCTQLPRQIKEKNGPLSAIEEEVLHQHCKNGVDICNNLRLPYDSILIVWQHHERLDGSGYPDRIKENKISPLANIVAVADAFDEMCNPVNRGKALTAHESLSLIYAQRRNHFDGKVLAALIRSIGAYPPGTLVSLTNGVIGKVMSVNSRRPLKPVVLAYDFVEENAEEREPILIDLAQAAGVDVVKTFNPQQLPQEIVDFLSGNKRTSYTARPTSEYLT